MTNPQNELRNTTSHSDRVLRPITPYDLSRFRAIAEAQSGQVGFLTEAQRAAMPHIVRLAGLTRAGLTRAALGDGRFERIYGLCKHCAEAISLRAFWAEAVVEQQVRIGNEFGFSHKLAALRFALCHEAAMRGQPLPLPPEVTP